MGVHGHGLVDLVVDDILRLTAPFEQQADRFQRFERVINNAVLFRQVVVGGGDRQSGSRRSAGGGGSTGSSSCSGSTGGGDVQGVGLGSGRSIFLAVWRRCCCSSSSSSSRSSSWSSIRNGSGRKARLWNLREKVQDGRRGGGVVQGGGGLRNGGATVLRWGDGRDDSGRPTFLVRMLRIQRRSMGQRGGQRTGRCGCVSWSGSGSWSSSSSSWSSISRPLLGQKVVLGKGSLSDRGRSRRWWWWWGGEGGVVVVVVGVVGVVVVVGVVAVVVVVVGTVGA